MLLVLGQLLAAGLARQTHELTEYSKNSETIFTDPFKLRTWPVLRLVAMPPFASFQGTLGCKCEQENEVEISSELCSRTKRDEVQKRVNGRSKSRLNEAWSPAARVWKLNLLRGGV